MFKKYSSNILEDTVNELSRLPGIGRRTALRLALHILKQDVNNVELLSNSIIKLRKEIKYCSVCHNISDNNICEICNNSFRNSEIICVVEDIRDVMAIENTGRYSGVYHVLNGVISPMDGIGPNDLNINQLIDRVSNNKIKEIILGLPPTAEGDTTNYYIYKKVKDKVITISAISRGVTIGDNLEYADEITLGKSIQNRVLYETTIQ